MKIAGQAIPHESARGHVTGEALYTDDLVGRFPGLLHAWPVLAPHPHARLLRLDVASALQEPGVHTTLTATDVPGEGDTGANRHDEPLFPTEVLHHQQPVAWVLAESLEAARLGAVRVTAEYEPLPAILTIEDAIAAPVTSRNGTSAKSAASVTARVTVVMTLFVPGKPRANT